MSPEPTERRRVLRFTPQGARMAARKSGTIAGLFGAGKDDFGGDVLDVSPLGVRWVGPRKAELGVRLRLTMKYKECTFEGVAVVKWSHPHAQAGRFVVGVEFDKLSDDQLGQLEKMQQAVARDQASRGMATPTPAPQPVVRPPSPPGEGEPQPVVRPEKPPEPVAPSESPPPSESLPPTESPPPETSPPPTTPPEPPPSSGDPSPS
jgi:hypothetical protein